MKALTKKQKLALRLGLTYTLMVGAVILLVTVLMFAVLGYQFNGKDGRVEQGGLLQFGSNPGGANVRIDGQVFGSQTPARTTFPAGTHTVNFNKTGYQPWQKTVELKAGTILWLNYARLVPADIAVTAVANVEGLTSAVASSNQQTIAATTKNSTEIVLYDISNEKVVTSTIALPDGLVSSQNKDAERNLVIRSWSGDNRHILAQYSSAEASPEGAPEWLLVDTKDPKNSKNVTAVAGLSLEQVKFSRGSASQLYVLAGSDLRLVDIGNGTISSPLAVHVQEFQLASDGLLTYVTSVQNDISQRVERTVGYLSQNANAGKTIRTLSDDGTRSLHIASGVYYGKRFVSIAHGNKIEVLSADLPDSASQDDVALQSSQAISVPHEGVDFLSMRTEGRFVIAQTGTSYTTYDLELQQSSTVTLPGSAAIKKPTEWIDNYHVWSDLDSRLRFYEFDGQNPTDIMPIAPGFDATLSQNGKYVYAFAPSGSGVYQLTRAQLLLR